MDTCNKRLLVSILVLAAVIRLATIFIFFRDYVPMNDAADWHLAAQNILAGHGLIYEKGFKAYRTPVPALYIAALYYIFGVSVRAVQMANVLLGTLTIWLVYDLTRRTFGIRSAQWAATLITFYPLLLFYTGSLLSETPTVILLALSLWMVWVFRNREPLYLVPTGLVLGFATLTRETMLPIAALISVWTWSIKGGNGWLRRIAPVFIILISVTLVLVPWALRNYLIFGSFVPLTSKGGLSLWIANNPLADGTGVEKVFAIPEFNSLPEVEIGLAYQKKAIEFIKENPLRFVRLSLRRLLYFWHLGYHGEGLPEVAFLAIYWPVFFLAIAGAWIGWRANRDATVLLLIVPVSLSLVHMVFLPEGRYRLPADMIMCMFAGNGAHRIVNRT